LRYAVEMPRLQSAFEEIGEIGTLLDAGAGGGYYAGRLYAARCRQLIIVEPFPDNLRIAKSTLASLAGQAQFFNASILNLPVAAKSVDCVTCTQVLEHIEDDAGAVKEFARVLRPGRYALITVPTPPEPFPNPGHVREGYTEEQLIELFASSGFLCRRIDWFMTRETLALGHWVQRLRGWLPTLFPLHELRESFEQRRDRGPYCLLGLFQKSGAPE
jgi:ubiquinone/menaquinone biosynthesis C-methylase UbiE